MPKIPMLNLGGSTDQLRASWSEAVNVDTSKYKEKQTKSKGLFTHRHVDPIRSGNITVFGDSSGPEIKTERKTG